MFFEGNAGCADFRVFRQDPPRSCDIRCDGCHYRIWVALSIGLSVTLVVFSAVIVCIVLALVFSLYILFSQPKQIRVVDVVHRRVAKPTLRKEAVQRGVLGTLRRMLPTKFSRIYIVMVSYSLSHFAVT
ncbi:hypothetical protein OSTOST_21085 [Ostertagia ostertagi]